MKNTKRRTEYLKPLSIQIAISNPNLLSESGVTSGNPEDVGAKGNNGGNENIDDKELPGFNAWETWE